MPEVPLKIMPLNCTRDRPQLTKTLGIFPPEFLCNKQHGCYERHAYADDMLIYGHCTSIEMDSYGVRGRCCDELDEIR